VTANGLRKINRIKKFQVFFIFWQPNEQLIRLSTNTQWVMRLFGFISLI